MSVTKGGTKFGAFFKTVYNTATTDPYASQFKEASMNGNKEGMIKILVDMPCVEKLTIIESYKGKDDVKATKVYDKIGKAVRKDGDVHEEENRISILTETLFAASVTSRLFLDVLVDCAQYWYNSNAFVKCLKYCECMLALPANLYDKTIEGMKHFSEHRKACIDLKGECSKKLKVLSSQEKKQRKKCNANRRDPLEDASLAEWMNRVTTIPSIDGKRHAILESCSDAVVLQSDEKRGRHLVATRNIKAGSILIVEAPFAFSTNNEALDRNCLHCHATLKLTDRAQIPCHSCQTVIFCSEECRNESWDSYHRYECCVFDAFYETVSEQSQRRSSHLLLAYRMTIMGSLFSNAEKVRNDANERDILLLSDNFLRYHSTNAKESDNLGTREVYNPRDYRTVLNLETHCAKMDPGINLIRTIEAIFLTKCFTFVLSKLDVICSKETFISLAMAMLHHLLAINCNAYEIVENLYDKKAHVWEPRLVGGAIYPSVSLMNHSCYPNVVRHSYPSGIVVVRSLRFIGKGTEIVDCYGPHCLSEGRLSRREYLWKKYRFLCACEACTQNWQYPLPETMNYKCRTCLEPINIFALNEKEKDREENVSTKQCHRCNEKIDCKKIKSQFRKSVEKKLNAVSKMYKGYYEQALPQLFEHIQFIEKFFAAPNIETIKTQQCIIQCYNRFGCISH